MILLVDNYDSFTFNLERYLVQLGQQVCVFRNDDPRLQADLSKDFTAIVISPGPRAPRDAGFSLQIVKDWSGRLPILGVCLGHQAICEAFGGKIIRAQRPMHGRSSVMRLLPCRLFDSIPDGSTFARYHSLIACADTLPEWLVVTAWSEQQEIMAVAHREHPTFGVQFHPESILSPAGYRLLNNFLSTAGLPNIVQELASDLREALPESAKKSEWASATDHAVVLPTQPAR